MVGLTLDCILLIPFDTENLVQIGLLYRCKKFIVASFIEIANGRPNSRSRIAI